MIVTTLVPGNSLPFEISVVFSEPDITRLGLPPEAPLTPRDETSSGERRQADIPVETLFFELDTDDVEVGCFEAPLNIRNDTTRETVLLITDYCPGEIGPSFSLTLFGVYGLRAETGWEYNRDGVNSGCCRVVVERDESTTTS